MLATPMNSVRMEFAPLAVQTVPPAQVLHQIALLALRIKSLGEIRLARILAQTETSIILAHALPAPKTVLHAQALMAA